MKHLFKTILFAAALLVANSVSAAEPLFSFHTDIYSESGSDNQFSMTIGVSAPMVLYVDCGSGPDFYEFETIGDTLIYCSVTDAGNVVVSGESAADAAKIDHLNITGGYVETIDLSRLVNLDVLDLSHNLLQTIDLSKNTKLRAIYLTDNTFTKETPLVIGEKPDLRILEMQVVDWLDPNFDMTKYPKLLSFDAYHCPTLTKIDPTNCPLLLQLTLEMTNVSSLDVSKNDSLIILNISETAIEELDVTHNKRLQQLFVEHVSGTFNTNTRLNKLDITNCPDIYHLIANGNNFTELDVTHNPLLIHLALRDNYLTSIDLSKQYQLSELNLDYNCFDFATLPMNPGTWETYTYPQRALPTERSYKEGDVLDFSRRVLREGTTTDMALYSFDATTPGEWVKLDNSYYTYEDGKVTLLKAHTDSMLIVFANTAFLEYNLETEHFKVKVASDYGKPTTMLQFMPSVANARYQIGIEGATPENPKTFYMEYYDNTQQKTIQVEQTTTGATLVDATWQVANLQAYANITISVPENTTITALGMDSLGLSSLNLERLMGLKELSLVGNRLSDVDLSRNRYLRSLDLSHNSLYGHFSLAGVNSLFEKNMLAELNLSHNEITELTLSPLLALRHLDLSHNKIVELDVRSVDSIYTMDVSYNQLETLDVAYGDRMYSLNASHNILSEIILPELHHLTELAINDNLFTLANLPHPDNIAEEHFHYAPQADIVIAQKGPCADLTNQDVRIDGVNTVFQWIKEDGTALVEGTDYTISNGLTRFINTTVGKVYCALSHAAFPDFADANVLKTTQMLVAGMPTNEIASFVTANDGDSVALSLAAGAEGTALYIDWEGNDNVVQYILGTQYRLFSAVTHKDATVRVYTYEPTETITVFSMGGATLKSFDGSKLNDAINISVRNAGLSAITLPTNKNTLSELSLEGNAFTSVDFVSAYPNLYTFSVNKNLLTSLDLSSFSRLGLVNAAQNAISTVHFNNPSLWYLDLSTNAIESIDFTGATNITQLSLGHNLLKTLDVSKLNRLIALQINNNYFDFQTLPLPKAQYVLYNYYNQAQLDVQVTNDSIVDLSRQAQVGDSQSTYTWYLGVPTWNSDMLAWEGEELYVDVEYTLENGVTTFLRSFEDVMCLITNPTFPNLYLYTDLFDVKATTGLEDIMPDGLSLTVRNRDIVLNTTEPYTVSLYTISGMHIASTIAQWGETTITAPAAGAYILRIGTYVHKILVP